MRSGGRLPLAVIVIAAAGVSLLVVPLLALLIDAPWTRLTDLLLTTETLTAVRVSLIVSLSAAAISVVIGVPTAFVLARHRFPGRALVRTIVTVPLVLPPVVTGVALLSGFGRRGLLGSLTGWGLANTTAGAVLAATMVAMPFLILSVEGALRNADPRHEQLAASLGARPFARWWQVSLPLARPSILAGAILAWARAMGEFGATITFAGNIEGVSRTLPLEVSIALQGDEDRALAVSLLMLAIALTVLVTLRDRWVPRR
ncbi:MAG: molybdate ABC transporter permease subunit [Actinomycetota bacterium]